MPTFVFLYFFAKALPTFVILPSKLILITLWKGKVYTNLFLFNFVLNTFDVFCHTTCCQLLRINDIIVFLWNFESFFIFLRRWKFESWNVQSHFFYTNYFNKLEKLFFEKNKLENFVVEPWTKITNNLDGKMQFCSYCFGSMQKSRANTSNTFFTNK